MRSDDFGFRDNYRRNHSPSVRSQQLSNNINSNNNNNSLNNNENSSLVQRRNEDKNRINDDINMNNRLNNLKDLNSRNQSTTISSLKSNYYNNNYSNNNNTNSIANTNLSNNGRLSSSIHRSLSTSKRFDSDFKNPTINSSINSYTNTKSSDNIYSNNNSNNNNNNNNININGISNKFNSNQDYSALKLSNKSSINRNNDSVNSYNFVKTNSNSNEYNLNKIQNYKNIFGKKDNEDKNIIKNDSKENSKNVNSKPIFEIIRGTKSDLKNSKLDHSITNNSNNNDNISNINIINNGNSSSNNNNKSKFAIVKSKNTNSLYGKKFSNTKESSISLVNNNPLKVVKKEEDNEIGLNNIIFKKEDLNKKFDKLSSLNNEEINRKEQISNNNITPATAASPALNNLEYSAHLPSVVQPTPNKMAIQDQEKIIEEIDEIDAEILKYENMLKTISNDMKETKESIEKNLSEKAKLIDFNKKKKKRIENIKKEKEKCEEKKQEREVEIKFEIEERKNMKIEALRLKKEKEEEEKRKQDYLEAKKNELFHSDNETDTEVEKFKLLYQSICDDNKMEIENNLISKHEDDIQSYLDTISMNKNAYKDQINYIIEKNNNIHKKIRPILFKKLLNHYNIIKHKEKFLKYKYKSYYQNWKNNIELLDQSKPLRRNFAKELNPKAFNFIYTRSKHTFTSDMARSEAEFEDILARLQSETDNASGYDERKSARIPPMILNSIDKYNERYVNRNQLVEDPKKDLDEYNSFFYWTDEEKKIFRSKLIQYGKNFTKIAECLEFKSTANCVQYYYREKNKEGFKKMLKRAATGNHGKRRRNANGPRRKTNKVQQSDPIREKELAKRRKERENSHLDDDSYQAKRKKIKNNGLDNDKYNSKKNKNRRTSHPPSADEDFEESSQPHYEEVARWTEEDKDKAMEAFKLFGRDFASVSQMVGTKTEDQCRNFYHNYKRKLNLDVVVKEFDRSRKNKKSNKNNNKLGDIETSVSSANMEDSVDSTSLYEKSNGKKDNEKIKNIKEENSLKENIIPTERIKQENNKVNKEKAGNEKNQDKKNNNDISTQKITQSNSVSGTNVKVNNININNSKANKEKISSEKIISYNDEKLEDIKITDIKNTTSGIDYNKKSSTVIKIKLENKTLNVDIGNDRINKNNQKDIDKIEDKNISTSNVTIKNVISKQQNSNTINTDKKSLKYNNELTTNKEKIATSVALNNNSKEDIDLNNQSHLYSKVKESQYKTIFSSNITNPKLPNDKIESFKISETKLKENTNKDSQDSKLEKNRNIDNYKISNKKNKEYSNSKISNNASHVSSLDKLINNEPKNLIENNISNSKEEMKSSLNNNTNIDMPSDESKIIKDNIPAITIKQNEYNEINNEYNTNNKKSLFFDSNSENIGVSFNKNSLPFDPNRKSIEVSFNKKSLPFDPNSKSNESLFNKNDILNNSDSNKTIKSSNNNTNESINNHNINTEDKNMNNISINSSVKTVGMETKNNPLIDNISNENININNDNHNSNKNESRYNNNNSNNNNMINNDNNKIINNNDNNINNNNIIINNDTININDNYNNNSNIENNNIKNESTKINNINNDNINKSKNKEDIINKSTLVDSLLYLSQAASYQQSHMNDVKIEEDEYSNNNYETSIDNNNSNKNNNNSNNNNSTFNSMKSNNTFVNDTMENQVYNSVNQYEMNSGSSDINYGQDKRRNKHKRVKLNEMEPKDHLQFSLDEEETKKPRKVQRRQRRKTIDGTSASTENDSYPDGSSISSLSQTNSPQLSSLRKTPSSYWAVAEKQKFKKALQTYGRDWDSIAKYIKSKTAIQVKNYYLKDENDKIEFDEILRNSGFMDNQTSEYSYNIKKNVQPLNTSANTDILDKKYINNYNYDMNRRNTSYDSSVTMNNINDFNNSPTTNTNNSTANIYPMSSNQNLSNYSMPNQIIKSEIKNKQTYLPPPPSNPSIIEIKHDNEGNISSMFNRASLPSSEYSSRYHPSQPQLQPQTLPQSQPQIQSQQQTSLYMNSEGSMHQNQIPPPQHYSSYTSKNSYNQSQASNSSSNIINNQSSTHNVPLQSQNEIIQKEQPITTEGNNLYKYINFSFLMFLIKTYINMKAIITNFYALNSYLCNSKFISAIV